MLIKEILLGLLALALIMQLDFRVSNKFNNKKMKYVIEKIIEKEGINQFSLIDDILYKFQLPLVIKENCSK